MPHMLIFGMGYTASRLAQRLRADGWTVTGTRREATDGALAFDNALLVLAALADATHVLSSVPPDSNGSEPVLDDYGRAIKAASLEWSGYLSSTGVYGDADGAWVDESAPIGSGRRKARSEAQEVHRSEQEEKDKEKDSVKSILKTSEIELVLGKQVATKLLGSRFAGFRCLRLRSGRQSQARLTMIA